MMMKELLENKLIGKKIKQYKGTMGLNKDISENIIFSRDQRNKQTYALNLKLLHLAIHKSQNCDVACQADIKTT